LQDAVDHDFPDPRTKWPFHPILFQILENPDKCLLQIILSIFAPGSIPEANSEHWTFILLVEKMVASTISPQAGSYQKCIRMQ
jgi:hypothetical protein